MEVKTKDIRFRVTEEEKEEYKELAEALGFSSLATLIRTCLDEKKEILERVKKNK